MNIGNFSIVRRATVKVKRQRPTLSSSNKKLNNLLNDNLDARNGLKPNTEAFKFEQTVLNLLKEGTEHVFGTLWYECFGTNRATSDKGAKKQFKKLRALLPVVIMGINIDYRAREGMTPLGIKRLGVKSVGIGLLTPEEFTVWLAKREKEIERSNESISLLSKAISQGSNEELKTIAATA